MKKLITLLLLLAGLQVQAQQKSKDFYEVFSNKLCDCAENYFSKLRPETLKVFFAVLDTQSEEEANSSAAEILSTYDEVTVEAVVKEITQVEEDGQMEKCLAALDSIDIDEPTEQSEEAMMKELLRRLEKMTDCKLTYLLMRKGLAVEP